WHASTLSPAPSPSATYSLSLHDALPILYSATRSDDVPGWARIQVMSLDSTWVTTNCRSSSDRWARPTTAARGRPSGVRSRASRRSEEHTSELQSRENLVCRLLLEKKKKQ